MLRSNMVYRMARGASAIRAEVRSLNNEKNEKKRKEIVTVPTKFVEIERLYFSRLVHY
jgi:hypothetical protein